MSDLKSLIGRLKIVQYYLSQYAISSSRKQEVKAIIAGLGDLEEPYPHIPFFLSL